MFWNLEEGKKITETERDDERELLLPRGCTFEVLSVDSLPFKYTKRESKLKMIIKHYVLRLCSQPTDSQHRKSYKYLEDTTKLNMKLVPHFQTHVPSLETDDDGDEEDNSW